jgi:RNA polymerase sigma-70 factor (ECF subfamily)
MQQAAAEGRFEAVVMPHLNALYQTAVRLTDSRADANELVHGVYACAFESFDLLNEDTHWRLALFKMLIQRTRRRYSDGHESPKSRSHKSETYSCSPDGILSTIDKMPLVLREVLLLVDCQGFSYSEAADILGVPKETVAERVSAARTYLRASAGTPEFQRASENAR